MYKDYEKGTLCDYFALLPSEMELLSDKNERNRLVTAVLLKYFQNEGRFPEKLHEIPEKIVRYIGNNIQASTKGFWEYNIEGRSVRRYKEDIRNFVGFRKGTTNDSESVKEWVCSNVTENDHTIECLKVIIYKRYKELKIEPPSPGRVVRLAGSVLNTLEQKFFAMISKKILPTSKVMLDGLLEENQKQLSFTDLKSDPGRIGLKSFLNEITKLQRLNEIKLPIDLLSKISEIYLRRQKLRVSAETMHEMCRHPDNTRHVLMAIFSYIRIREIIDALIELLIQIIHKIGVNSEKKVNMKLLSDIKKVAGKNTLLYQLASISLDKPEGVVKEVIYPVVKEQILQNIIKEYKSTGYSYLEKVHTVMRASYSHHYRRMVPKILSNLDFKSNNNIHKPVIQALDLIRKYSLNKQHFFPQHEDIPIDGVMQKGWKKVIVEKDFKGKERINRINYEICVLQALRERLRCKEIWVLGANRYRNPELDLPTDFETQRALYYHSLNKPLDVESFIGTLQQQMSLAIEELDNSILKNKTVKINQKKKEFL